ncbi:MAG: hypothetical protein ABSH20_00070 [Tepidisphaeraceae bacterium]
MSCWPVRWRLIEFQRREGTLKADDGSQAKIQGRVEVAVDAPVLKVIGLYCGPIAVLSGQGSASAAPASSGHPAASANAAVLPPQGGSTGAGSGGGSPAPASAAIAMPTVASGGESMLWRLIILLVGLTAASAALLKAQFAPLVSVPQIGALRTSLDDNKLGLIGVGCALVGVLWLLKSFIYRDFFVTAAITAAGLMAALDLLVARGIIAEDFATRLRPNTKLVGLACVALVIIHLVTGGKAVLI